MATKKVLLADVLWDAANKHLLASPCGHEYMSYSCNAAVEACGYGNWSATDDVLDFLCDLGVETNHQDYTFGTRTTGPKRQGVRYMWLLLAMHVAEDEGIEIEVEA